MTKEEAEAAHQPVPIHAGELVLPEHGEGILNPSGEAHNMFVTAGIAGVVQTIGYGLTPVTVYRYVAVGTDNTAVATTQTQLVAEATGHGWARVAATVSAQTTTLAGDTLRLVAVFTLTAGANETINEIMIGNNASANTGTMLCRGLTGAITLPAGAVVTFTYNFAFANV
jgi:predicted cobalt transporter CbtA